MVIYDSLIPEELLEEVRKEAEKIFAGRHAWKYDQRQDEINHLMVERALDGLTVVRLKGGDPLIFGRAGEEMEALWKAEVPFEVVPGITAASAGAAAAGIPLTHREWASAVTFITGHEAWWKQERSTRLREFVKAGETLVFYMPVKKLPEIVEELKEAGMESNTPCVLIHRAYTPSQRSVKGTLQDIVLLAEKVQMSPPALFIVGRVCRYADLFNWYERRPLFGIGVINTRARHQARDMTRLLKERGAYVFHFPVIEIKPIVDGKSVKETAKKIQAADYVVFTSRNGVHVFMEALFKAGMDARVFGRCQLVCIGSATAEALQVYSLRADVVPEKFVAEGVLEHLIHRGDIRTRKVLIIRAEKAREILPETLRSHGAHVEVIPVYRTVMPEEVKEKAKVLQEEVQNGGLHCVTFTSSSTVENFFRALGEDAAGEILGNLHIAVIGPVTRETIKGKGFKPDIEPENFTVEALVSAIESFYKGKRERIS